MKFATNDLIFDTLVDTTKIYVSMNHKFTIRKMDGNPKRGLIYLYATGNKEVARINLDIHLDVKNWNSKKQRIVLNDKHSNDLNLILDNIYSKIISIKTSYRLAEKVLTPKKLEKELKQNLSRVSFLAFFKQALESERSLMEHGSYKRHLAVYHKLGFWKNDILFSDIDYHFFEDYKKHFIKKGNALTTINSNIISMRKFIRIAIRHGIKIGIDLDDIKIGSTRGNRFSLSAIEFKKCFKYYTSDFIEESNKLVLGYFLFSCVTGLRISDVQKLTRTNLYEDYITFVSKKTKTDQSITLNLLAKDIINNCDELFIKKFSDPYINLKLKTIASFLGITKKVTFHVARHTFATNYLRAGGSITNLQKLLGHRKIEMTMIYSHIVNQEANDDIFRLDDLLR
jgi:integrase/recombinase XerD